MLELPASALPLSTADNTAFASSESGPASLPVPQPTEAFWTHGEPNCNPLATEGSSETLPDDVDVCIIGSGITGVSCAYHLSELVRGSRSTAGKGLDSMKVVILEARDFCSGATGRNGGHLTASIFSRMHDLTLLHGSDEAAKSPALEDHTVSALVRLIRENKWETDVDFVEGGRVELMFTQAEVDEVERDIAAARKAGVQIDGRVDRLTDLEVDKTYGTKHPGYRFAGYNLWPLKLMTKMYLLAKGSSSTRQMSLVQSFLPSILTGSPKPDPFQLSLHTHTPVTSVTRLKSSDASDPSFLVETPRGTIRAHYVVHATNAYASHLLPEFSGTAGIIPTRGQVVAALAPVSKDKLWKCSFTGNEGFEYWFARPCSPSSRPLVILGGGREGSGPGFEINVADDSSKNEEVSKTLKAFLPSAFPHQFGEEVEPKMEWTGIMGFTATHDPFVGLTSGQSGEFISAGYSGHGMPRSFACAEIVAQMLIADKQGEQWKSPVWLPAWYLTPQSRMRLDSSRGADQTKA